MNDGDSTKAGRLLQTTVRWAGDVVDFLAPQRCRLAGLNTDCGESPGPLHAGLCDACYAELFNVSPQSCLRCGAPIGPHVSTGEGCVFCRKDRFHVESVVRIGQYDGLLRTACLAAKRTENAGVSASLADVIWNEHAGTIAGWNIDIVTGVPRHWYDRLVLPRCSSETMAEVLARRLHARNTKHILSKTRRTPPQAELSPTARRKNLRGAFRVRSRQRVAGRRILLVDDVLTTGATANEIAKVLREAGAEIVFAAVAARGLGRHGAVGAMTPKATHSAAGNQTPSDEHESW